MSKKVQLEGNFGGSREDIYPATMAEIVYAKDGKNLEEKINETNAQLLQKANKSDIGSPLIAKSLEEMKDITKVYVNASDGHWYSYNGSNWVDGGVYNSHGIGDNSITPEKTTFYEFYESPNIFNKDAVVDGKQLGVNIDETTEYSSRSISSPMQITPTKSLTATFNQPLELIVFYDNTGKRLGGYSFSQFSMIDGGYSISFNHATDICYIMCQFRNELASTSANYCDIDKMMIVLDKLPQDYIAFGEDIHYLSGERVALYDFLKLPNSRESDTCTFFGSQAGENNVESTTNDDGRYNVAIGVRAMQKNTTGDHNTAVGYQSLMKNTTGDYNTAYGEDTLYENTTGINNTAIGIRTMQNNLTGNRNTVVGGSSLYNNTTGSMNTVIGQNAGQAVKNTDGNTCIGYSSNVGSDTENAIAIGRSSVNEESNTALIGNNSTKKTKTYGDFECLSDGGGVILRDANGVPYKLSIDTTGSIKVETIV